jgi:hypothetical protein
LNGKIINKIRTAVALDALNPQGRAASPTNYCTGGFKREIVGFNRKIINKTRPY